MQAQDPTQGTQRVSRGSVVSNSVVALGQLTCSKDMLLFLKKMLQHARENWSVNDVSSTAIHMAAIWWTCLVGSSKRHTYPLATQETNIRIETPHLLIGGIANGRW